MSIAPPSETWSLISKDFDFDQDVLNTEVYRAAWRSNMRNAARTWKGKMSQVHEDELEETPTLPLTNEESTHATFYLPGPSEAAFSELPHRRQDGPPPLPPPPSQSLFKEGMHRVDDKNDEITANTTISEVPVKRVVSQASLSTSRWVKVRGLSKSPGLQPSDKRKTISAWKSRIPRMLVASSGLKSPQSGSHLEETKWRPAEPLVQEFKLLILGSGESGKSTFLKSTKLALEGGYSRDERECFKDIVFSNTVQSMRVILEAMEDLEIPFGDERSAYHAQSIYMQPKEIEAGVLPQEAGRAIEELWNDSGVKETFDRSNEYQLLDAAA
jgi:hypothetical protein